MAMRILAALLSLGTLMATLAEAAVTVRIPPEARLAGDEISLGDLATIEGNAALAGRVAAIRLGSAPGSGGSLRLDAEFLHARLRQSPIDLARVSLLVPDSVLVIRASALTVMLGARVDGRDYQTAPLTLRVGHYRMVFVANNGLEPKTVLSAADFRAEPRVSFDIPRGALTLPDPGGLEAVRPIKAGEIVTDHQRPRDGFVVQHRLRDRAAVNGVDAARDEVPQPGHPGSVRWHGQGLEM
jgi:SAF domain